MPLIRLSKEFPPRAATKYARPAREKKTTDYAPPEPGNQFEEWCDEYMVRLYKSTILTTNRADKPPSARTAGTDSAVLGALCSIMRGKECGCFAATESELAERAQMAPGTVGSALRRLENAAYIVKHPSPRYGAPSKYSLVIEKLEPLAPGDPHSIADITDIDALATGDLSHEAFRARALGKTATKTYVSLAQRPNTTMADLAHATGRNKSTISRSMKKLRAVNMGYEEDGLWEADTRRVATDDDLDKVVVTTDKIRSQRRYANVLAKQEREEQKAREERSLELLYNFCAARELEKASCVADDAERSSH